MLFGIKGSTVNPPWSLCWVGKALLGCEGGIFSTGKLPEAGAFPEKTILLSCFHG